MGIADDFMSAFFVAYPQAQSGKLGLEELKRLMAEYQRNINGHPLADFDGLSPDQMNVLLHAPFSHGAILQFRQDMESHVDKSPFFKLSELLLQEISQAGSLKLTATGNLPVRICERLWGLNLIYWPYMEHVKRIIEDEIPYLWPLKQYLLDEGILKKRNNALSFTKTGVQLLKEPQAVRFIRIFQYMASRFHWGNFYDLKDNGKCGQLGWAYALVLLSKYGDQPRKSEFYSLKLMRAFEKEWWEAHQKGKQFETIAEHHDAYQARFFECFADWFGLIEMERKGGSSYSCIDRLTVKRSALFDQLFEVKAIG